MFHALLLIFVSIMKNPSFRIIITSMALVFKGIVFLKIISKKNICKSLRKTHVLLSLTLFFSLFEDIAWILHILHATITLPFGWIYISFFIKIAWIATTIRNTTLILFLESLFHNFLFSVRHFIYLLLSSLFISGFLVCAAGQILGITFLWAVPFMKLSTIYTHVFLFLPTAAILLYKISYNNCPRIFKKQLKTTIYFFLLPYTFIDFFWMYPTNMEALYICMLNIIIPALIFYCTKKLVNLRFLNMKNYVQTPTRFSFIKNFTEILENLAQASTVGEISLITKNLFHKVFTIPNTAVHIYISTSSRILPSSEYDNTAAVAISSLLSTPDNQLLKTIHNAKILIYDEIDFTHYYESSHETQNLLAFLDNINTDVFIPIFNQQKIVGCITIDKAARPKAFYGHTERAEMIIFASYLGNIINLLQNRNLEQVLVREKELKQEIYTKRQENNQCKEILRTLIKSDAQKKIGIVFYKTRQFVFGNQEAQELVQINLNIHAGHPMAKTCRQVVADVERYKTTQKQITMDDSGNKIVVCGMPYLERTQVILLIYHQEAPDLILNQLNQLQDPSSWDYLFYLQTTDPGRIINNLIPGDCETILNFKIELLKIIFSLKATLLNVPSDDIEQTVELIHHVSGRTHLHAIELEEPQKNSDLTINLFGINPLLNSKTEDSLLKKLDETGTLFIKNIQYLNKETQEKLAHFIRYGFFTPYKGDQKTFSNVRIICSTNQPITTLVHKGFFSNDLYEEIKQSVLTMPSLHTLTRPELEELLNGFAQQAVADKTIEKIIEFNEKDICQIINAAPSSFAELKKRVTTILMQKLKSSNIDQKNIDPAHFVSDPELVEIARLGKRALKNEKIMAILWNKFNNQNKIAAFLGVNRSSVNRRCKDYNLT